MCSTVLHYNNGGVLVYYIYIDKKKGTIRAICLIQDDARRKNLLKYYVIPLYIIFINNNLILHSFYNIYNTRLI